MRRTAVALAALLMAAGTSPVLAGGGVPKLANVDAGPHQAELFNDSPSLVTGTNGLTIQIRGLTSEHVVSLALEGPDGARVPVPLTRVIVVGDLEGDDHSHAEEGDDHGAAPVDDHPSPHLVNTAPEASDPHGATHAGSHSTADTHGASTGAQPLARVGQGSSSATTMTETYLARGSASLPTTGTWTARLVIHDPHGEDVVGEAPLAVVEGGPSKLYLGFTGSLIFGSMLFGLIQRRRQPTRSSTTR